MPRNICTKIIRLESMSDSEIFDIPVGEIKVTPKAKPARVKKEISPERKAQLLENLKKGRETAKRNRAAKAKKSEKSSETPVPAAEPATASVPKGVSPEESESGAELKALRAEMRRMKEENELKAARAEIAALRKEREIPEPTVEKPKPVVRAPQYVLVMNGRTGKMEKKRI